VSFTVSGFCFTSGSLTSRTSTVGAGPPTGEARGETVVHPGNMRKIDAMVIARSPTRTRLCVSKFRMTSFLLPFMALRSLPDHAHENALHRDEFVLSL
jgi:hypothetical protein